MVEVFARKQRKESPHGISSEDSRNGAGPGVGGDAIVLGQQSVAAMMSRLSSAYASSTETQTRAGQLAYLSRCAVLQAIGATFVTGLWIAGIADKPFAGDNAFLCWLIVGVAALGVLCLFLQRWKDVEWIAVHVVRVGLLGTVIGLIIAFSAASAGGSDDPDQVRAMIAQVVDGMYVSLYATLLAIATNLWLKINLRLLGGQHG